MNGCASRAIWSSWKVPGEDRVLWALQVSTRQVRGATGGRAPANDGYVLAAWGDGPVIAWANDVMHDHPGRLGILVTHAYLNNDDRTA